VQQAGECQHCLKVKEKLTQGDKEYGRAKSSHGSDYFSDQRKNKKEQHIYHVFYFILMIVRNHATNVLIFQCTQPAHWPIFGLARACVDWAQRWLSTRGHAALEQRDYNQFISEKR
jgi:hypothetical protein